MHIFTRSGWGTMATGEPPRIPIVGGGFAGMCTARHLRRRLRPTPGPPVARP